MSLLGPEKVTNGAFASGTGWTAGNGWSIGGGVATYTHNATPGDLSPATALSVITGRSYLVVFTASAAAGVFLMKSYIGGTVSDSVVADGSYSSTAIATDTTDLIFDIESSSAGSTCAIDDVSVKEISAATTIEAALFDLLILNSTVSAQVSRRVYPQIIPQNTSYPAIRYNQISGVRDHTLTDTSQMVPARFQIDCYGSSYANARTMAAAVRGVLDNYHGTVGSIVIQCVHLIDEGDYFSEQVGVDQLRRYGKTQDYMIWYNE